MVVNHPTIHPTVLDILFYQTSNWKWILTGTDHDVERELIESVLFIGIARAETERCHESGEKVEDPAEAAEDGGQANVIWMGKRERRHQLVSQVTHKS